MMGRMMRVAWHIHMNIRLSLQIALPRRCFEIATPRWNESENFIPIFSTRRTIDINAGCVIRNSSSPIRQGLGIQLSMLGGGDSIVSFVTELAMVCCTSPSILKSLEFD